MSLGNDALSYTIKIDTTDVSNNGVVASVNAGDTTADTSVTLSLAFSGTPAPKYAGQYTDTLTFTVDPAVAQ